jgi:glycerol-3-phosphate acyltransferase PlsY
MNIILVIPLIILAYLIGAIPTGYWFAKMFANVDVTKKGSGNIGATNVARVLGNKKYFVLIFSIDFLKSFGLIYLLRKFIVQHMIFLLTFAVFLLIGNAYSVFLKFRGGKGVATSVGILMALLPWQVFVAFLISWMGFIFIVRRVDVASLLSMVIATIVCAFVTSLQSLFFIFMIFLNLWLWLRHRKNIKGLIFSR